MGDAKSFSLSFELPPRYQVRFRGRWSRCRSTMEEDGKGMEGQGGSPGGRCSSEKAVRRSESLGEKREDSGEDRRIPFQNSDF